MNSYQEKLKDPRWQKMRLKIFERDGWACTKCKSADKTLHVHHERYLGNREPWDYPDHYLVTVCHSCHEDEHNIAPQVNSVPTLDDYLAGGRFEHLLSADERAQALARREQELVAASTRRAMLVRAREMGIY